MMNEIGCKKCSSFDCHGCNMFILSKALRSGVFTPVMSMTMSIDIDALKEKLAERETGRWVKDRYCSNCDWSNEEVYFTFNWTGRYCPNCGAEMEVDT